MDKTAKYKHLLYTYTVPKKHLIFRAEYKSNSCSYINIPFWNKDDSFKTYFKKLF